MQRNGILFLFFNFLALIPITSCNLFSSPAEEKSEVLIGYVDSFSGPAADYGRSVRNGIFLAVDDHNRIQNSLDTQIRLVIYDDKGNAEKTKQLAERAVVKDKVVAFFGASASSRSHAMATVAQKHKIPMILAASTHPKVTKVGDHIFRVCFIDQLQGEAMAKYLLEDLELQKVGVLIDSEIEYSRDLGEIFTQSFSVASGKTVRKETYASGDVDYSEQLQRLKEAQVEAIYVPGFYPEAIAIAKQARSMKLKIPFHGADGWDTSELKSLGGEVLNGAVFTSHFSAENPAQNYQNFEKKYVRKYGQDPNAFAALGFDAASVMVEALSDVQLAGSEEIFRGLNKKRSYAGVTGNIRFDENRNPIKPVVLLKIVDSKAQFLKMLQP